MGLSGWELSGIFAEKICAGKIWDGKSREENGNRVNRALFTGYI